jgi:hypothetical protein
LLAELSALGLFRTDRLACYSPRPMTEPSLPLQQPVWWRFAVSVTCTVTLLLAAVGFADVWTTLQG